MKTLCTLSATSLIITKFIFNELETDKLETDLLPIDEEKNNQKILIKEASFDDVKEAIDNVITKKQKPESASSTLEVWGFSDKENEAISSEFLAKATTIISKSDENILNFEKEGFILIDNGEKMFLISSEEFKTNKAFSGVDFNLINKVSAEDNLSD